MKTGSYREQQLRQIIEQDGQVPENVANAYLAWTNNLLPERGAIFSPDYHIKRAENSNDLGNKSINLVWAAHALLSDGSYASRVEPVRRLLSEAAKYRAEYGREDQAKELETLANSAEEVVRISGIFQRKIHNRNIPNFNEEYWMLED